MISCLKSLALNEGSQVALGLTLFKERMNARRQASELQKNWHMGMPVPEGLLENLQQSSNDNNNFKNNDQQVQSYQQIGEAHIEEREVGDRKNWQIRNDKKQADDHLKHWGILVREGG